jgi:predicted helicase
MQYQQRDIFGPGHDNIAILIDAGAKAFSALATKRLPDYHVNGDSICFPRFRYDDAGNKIDNITEWAVFEFRRTYKGLAISRDEIFEYVYGVLHDPRYRERYSINLKRGLPRIPYYSDFKAWAEWGKELIRLHTQYEDVKPWSLKRIDVAESKSKAAGVAPRAILRADQLLGIIYLNGDTKLTGVPAKAWEYKIGNQSALNCVLDQFTESAPRDATIREKFNAYKFAAHKEAVIDLLSRLTRVSVETAEILDAMNLKGDR